MDDQMNGPLDRWEHGSEFHWPSFEPASNKELPWVDGSLYGSGRDALRALISYGIAERGWSRIWLPAYFCGDVTDAIASTGIGIALYPDGPEDDEPRVDEDAFRRGDVLLEVDYFGLRSEPRFSDCGIEVIEDHTHDPVSDWAKRSGADWCVASLRKTLPLPDGGVLWSPKGHKAPPQPPISVERSSASLLKERAMVMKRDYLAGEPVEKEAYRELAVEGEQKIASGEISGMTERSRDLLREFPIDEWRETRRVNYNALRDALVDLDWLKILEPEDGARPFSGIAIFDSPERRDVVRDGLIARRIYPAVLWPLDGRAGIPERYIDLSRRMLSIHCDMRYNERDMMRVADAIREIGERQGC